MFTFRGDAHKVYLHLKKRVDDHQPIKTLKDMVEIEEIQAFYQSLDPSELKLIQYRMVKEKNGTGIIPIFVTSIPWFFFLFSKQLQEFLFKDGRHYLWAAFSFLYLLLLTFSVILHFREKAWAAFHLEMIQDVLKEKNQARIEGK
nr:hypothetical protein [Neobacillus sp. Marseille-Q6967]